MANIKFHQIKQMLKRAKRKGKILSCEISVSDYEELKWLPQYLFWKDASLVNSLLMNGVDDKKLSCFHSSNDYICGIPCNLKGIETKVILHDGKIIKFNTYSKILGFLEATFNPKIEF
jgi:hypothetical protein